MSIEGIFLFANSNTLSLRGLRNAETGEYLNTATVVATVQDKDGNDVGGQVWPVTLNYIDASNGCYIIVLPHDLVLVPLQRYLVRVVAQGDGLTFDRERLIQAKKG